MRAINISNIKARNAQVGFEQKSIKHAFSMRRKDGMGYTNARFLKGTQQQVRSYFMTSMEKALPTK